MYPKKCKGCALQYSVCPEWKPRPLTSSTKLGDQCYNKDGGRPSADAVQAESANRLKVLEK